MIDSQFHYYYSHVVCLDVNGQFDSVQSTIESIKEKNVLIILVVYADEATSDADKSANQKLLHTLKKTYFGMWRAKNTEGISLHQTEHCGLLIINRSSGKLMMEQEALSCANQVATEAAIALIRQQNVRQPWIHFANAGSSLPADFFRRTKHVQHECVSYPFYFEKSPEYELALRHYFTQVQQAGSRYAFYTEPGTFALNTNTLHAIHYPNGRNAELELLNNISKQHPVETLDGDPIIFQHTPANKIPFYQPDIFKVLKAWMQIMDKFAPFANTKLLQEKVAAHEYAKQLTTAIEKIDGYAVIQSINYKTKDANVVRQHLQQWFDAVKTKTFIDALHGTHFPEASIAQLCEHYGFPSDDLTAVCSYFQPRLESAQAM